MAALSGAMDDIEAGHTPLIKPPVAAGVDRPILAATANLTQLLPSGTVMIYQMLASSFSNGGKCYSSNWYITMVLLVVLSLSCFFFVLTDSLVHNGKLYYGVAICGRLNVLNLSKGEEDVEFFDILPELRKRRLRGQDLVHAVLVVLVFLAMALTDVGIQNCFFPNAGEEAQQLFRNLPLGITAFASVLFSVFPTRRKFIGTSHHAAA